jgi:hypothetical protein
MLIPKITGGRRDDGPLRDNELATALNCAPDIFLTNKIQRSLTGLRAKFTIGATEVRLGSDIGPSDLHLKSDPGPIAVGARFGI